MNSVESTSLLEHKERIEAIITLASRLSSKKQDVIIDFMERMDEDSAEALDPIMHICIIALHAANDEQVDGVSLILEAAALFAQRFDGLFYAKGVTLQ